MKQFSDFKKGDMFFFNPLHMNFMEPEVYVMMDEGIVQGFEAKTFIKNSALVKHLINNYQPYSGDLWAITDAYYQKMSEAGHIIPIDDLREADIICKKFNLKMEEVI
jgi:hypothetical protein